MIAWLLLPEGDRLVTVKSWWPWWGPHGLEWPVVLIDRAIGGRETVVPVWDRQRLKDIWQRIKSRPNKRNQ